MYVKNLEELKKEAEKSKEVLIKKKPNSSGNFNYQFYNGSNFILGCFKTYADAVSFFYFEGFTKEKHLQNSVILSKE